MSARTTLWFDPEDVGPWSEVKHEILLKYATAYSKIMSAQTRPKFHHVYIDAFAGSGVNLSRQTGQLIRGSPLNALDVDPPFRDYHFIDLDGDKVERLHEMVGQRPGVHLYHGDSNNILINEVFPQVDYKDYRRGLCLLDPYGMQLDWDVIEAAAKLGTLDIFINFPIHDMNRSVLRRDSGEISEDSARRMTSFWGDESWRDVAYSGQGNLFGPVGKSTNEQIVRGYCERLRSVASFKYVAEPLPMRNSKNSILYYLVFASPKPVAEAIVRNIFSRYR